MASSATRIFGVVFTVWAVKSGRAVGPPFLHGIVDVGLGTSDGKVESSSVVKPRHADVDTIRGNGQFIDKLGDKGLEGCHLEVINGRRVIDKNPNVHFLIANAASWFGDCDVGPFEGRLVNGEDASIGEDDLADFGVRASS